MFRLDKDFIKQFDGKQPAWGYGDLSYFVYKRTYARKKDDDSLEEFWETCKRVVDGVYRIQERHCKLSRIPWSNKKAQKSAQEMFTRLWELKWTPPGRGLWSMGAPFLDVKGGAPLNNCGFVSTKFIDEDFADPFCWSMDMSMLGVGVGFDTEGAKLEVLIKEPEIDEDWVYVVSDDREGWVDAYRTVLAAHVNDGVLPGSFDYSKIRKEGEELKTFGGIASGPDPLISLINDLITMLLPKYYGKFVDSTLIVDLMNISGKCVVSGGIRRTAQISLGDPDDFDFLNLKNRDMHPIECDAWRWASNNSVITDPTLNFCYDGIAEAIKRNGEPGVAWMKNAREFGRMCDPRNFADMRVVGVNPCAEQSLEHKELCTLVETYPSRHESYEDYKRTLKFAYLYAKTVTLVATHCEETNAVMMRNRRIGLSQSGIVDAIEKFGYREYISKFCDMGYRVIEAWDKIYSDFFCVPRSIKMSSIKPSGSVSLLAGVPPGMHYSEAIYQIKRIRVAISSPFWARFSDAGYHVEDDVAAPLTKVIEFPLMPTINKRVKSEVTMWEQLSLAADLQRWWADNQVSVTVTFNKNEENDISKALSYFEDKLKAVSFLPISEHGYEQAPNEAISKERYEEMLSKIKYRVDLSSDAEHEVTEKFCDGEFCML